jgi:hypothetical protein
MGSSNTRRTVLCAVPFCRISEKLRVDFWGLRADNVAYFAAGGFALHCCQRTAEGKMKGERRDHWLRLCVEAADEQDSNRFLEMIAEINHLLHEKQMRLTNVRREAGGYVIEAADEKARSSRRSISIPTALKVGRI